MTRGYLGSALGGALSELWSVAEARALFDRTDPGLIDGDFDRGFTVWAWSAMHTFRLAPVQFTPVEVAPRRQRRLGRGPRRGPGAGAGPPTP